jgi:nickel-dependent lactate racemase
MPLGWRGYCKSKPHTNGGKMGIELKYGRGTVEIDIPEPAYADILAPATAVPVASPAQALAAELARLEIDDPDLIPLIRNGEKVAIVIPDETRPLPVAQILPPFLQWLFAKNTSLLPNHITIIVGGGLHPPVTQTELNRLVAPEIVGGCVVLAHDALHSAMIDYGVTSRGTPVQVNRAFAEADHKIVIGQIDPHQFVGFTGGAKGAVIGCGGKATIEHNHSLMFSDNALVGRLAGNPVREDLNEAGEMIGIDLAVNVVMAPDNSIVAVFVGRPLAVLSEGVRVCADIYGVEITEPYDIIVASCGGYPKDICLYQAQKGLNLASQALREGGNILLLAASSQGVGDDVYFDYVSRFASPGEVMAEFKREGFRMGAHKAYLFGRTLSRFDVAVFSDLDPAILRTCHLRSAEPSEILHEWVAGAASPPRIGIVPNANTTYFYKTA